MFGLDLPKSFIIAHKYEGPLTPNLQLATQDHLYIIYHTGF